jgi:oligoribonuclease NrnB/cAMP/cGMP phosphodiesterase (DHH superfamily)
LAGCAGWDVFLNTKFAACELTWKYFHDNEPMPEAIRLLGRYDCFGHKGTDEEQKVLEFQFAARSIVSNPDEAEFFINADENDIEALLKNGKSIYKYLCVDAKQSYKLGFDIYFHDDIQTEKKYKFICFNKERFNPINFGIEYHKDGYDGAACFHYSGEDKKWHFSFYNENGKVDCSRIAKQFGGGGHSGAAGAEFDDISQFLNRK